MDAAKLLELITLELRLAHMLLELAEADTGDPTDPEGAARIIQYGRSALEAVRTFLPAARLSVTELVYIESELSYLEAKFEARGKRGRKSGRRIPTV